MLDHGLLHARDARATSCLALASDAAAEARACGASDGSGPPSGSCWWRRWSVGRPPSAALDEVNRALRFHYVTYLVPAPDGVSLDHSHEGDPVEGALARLAESVARELTQGRPERLRVCENQECRWIFVDTSHSGKRKWCDMRTCGNRVKVARHRQRRREEPSALDGGGRLRVVSEPTATPSRSSSRVSRTKRAFASAAAMAGLVAARARTRRWRWRQLASYAPRYAWSRRRLAWRSPSG